MRTLPASVPAFDSRILWCLAGFMACTPVHAQMTDLERAAQAGGRVMAAAQICRISAERIRSTSERMLSMLRERAGSVEAKASIARLFAPGQPVRAAVARPSRLQCAGVHVEFSELEVKLAKPPATTGAATKLSHTGAAAGLAQHVVATARQTP